MFDEIFELRDFGILRRFAMQMRKRKRKWDVVHVTIYTGSRQFATHRKCGTTSVAITATAVQLRCKGKE